MRRTFLISYRIREGKTQKEMAAKYNVTQQAWSSWELGTYAPTPFTMNKLANDIGVPMEKIFRDVFGNVY